MIKQVGNTQINPLHRLTCHCGKVELELTLPNGIEKPRRCDCSMCRRRGAIVASVPLSGIRIVQGDDVLKLIRIPRSIFSVVNVAFTHTINADQTQVSTVTTWDV